MKHRGMANMKFFKGTATQILGHAVQTPIGLGPIHNQKRYNYDGELASAQAARQLGVIYTLDIRSSFPLEQIL
jgi:isopentenyl diphosphate isomerase/L-lactate dehydrogenase-like FMN-dependent dehydrogenase